MHLTRTHLIVILSVTGLTALTACSSKPEVFQIESSDNRWFCTPQINAAEGEKEWLCQESDREFQRLAKQKTSPVENTSNQADTAIGVKTKNTEQPVEWVVTNAEQPVVDNLAEESEGVTTEPSESAEIQVQNQIRTQPQPQPQPHTQTQEEQPVESETDLETNLKNNPEAAISPWVIQLAAYTQASGATKLSQEVADSQTFNTRVKGRDYVTVVILGFAERWQALEKAEEIKRQYPQLSPWLRKGADFEPFIVR